MPGTTDTRNPFVKLFTKSLKREVQVPACHRQGLLQDDLELLVTSDAESQTIFQDSYVAGAPAYLRGSPMKTRITAIAAFGVLTAAFEKAGDHVELGSDLREGLL